MGTQALRNHRNRTARNLHFLCEHIRRRSAVAPLSAGERDRYLRLVIRHLHQLKKMVSAAWLAATLTGVAILLHDDTVGQNFLAPVPNEFGITAAGLTILDFGDLDGDGDYDLLFHSSNYPLGNFMYRENVGTATNPMFGPVQLNPFNLSTNTTDLFHQLVDIDNDGDLDLFSGSTTGAIRYMPNIGTPTSPNFSFNQGNPFGITPVNFFYFSDPHFMDIDDDGDYDLFTYDFPPGSFYANMLFQENTGDAQNAQFDTAVVVPFGLHQVAFGYSFLENADLDNDGDQDFLIGDFYSGEIRYQVNIGTAMMPQLGPVLPNHFNMTANDALSIPVLVDIDGDNDLDLFLSDSLEVNFMEQDSLSVGIGEFQAQSAVYPNPANDQLTVALNLATESIVELMNAEGRIVIRQVMLGNQVRLDITEVPAGVYILRVINDRGTFNDRLVVEH